MLKKRSILSLAIQAGEILLMNGAEIFRVQETIGRILDAFGIHDYSLYVVSNGIFVTLNEDREDSSFAMRNVPTSVLHLGRIDAVNELSRSIVKNPDINKLSYYKEQLRQCAELPPFPLWLRALCCGVGSGTFCYMFGGSVFDCAGALLCGLLLQILLTFYGRKKRSRFTHTILGAVLVSSLAVGMCTLNSNLSLDYIIIGSIMALVPGVALTTSIRDFFNGDFLSGNIHLIDATLTGVCIAVGVGVTLQFWQLVTGGRMSF